MGVILAAANSQAIVKATLKGSADGKFLLKRLDRPSEFVRFDQLCEGSTPCPQVLNFMASDCQACQVEMPIFLKIVKKYQDQKSLRVILISTDGFSNQIQAGRYLKNIDHRILQLGDPNGMAADFFGVTSIPRIFFRDRSGAFVGSISSVSEKFESQLKEQLDKIVLSR